MIILVWLRIVRIKFLLASIIAITNGLLYAYLVYDRFNIIDALLTYIGVIFLHASVDIFNDYWDYKRGIDTTTKRTKFSGGTGVLPEKKLGPAIVYKAGFLCMFIGLAIGGYFVIHSGLVIAVILIVAILSIYFYSTTIVNIGLGETLVAIKGAMIVIGTCYVQSGIIDFSIVFLGIISGMLSSVVLYIASFPDFDADKEKGRKTLVILLGKDKGSKIFPFLIIFIYILISTGIIGQYLPIYTMITFISLPFGIRSSQLLNTYDNIEDLVKAISNTLIFSRLLSICLLLSFIIAIINE
ncbi:MAG TPA: prenyltransferase [Nitrososphaeraceae archaeon]|nr:prenyltransferase [Nitrososphaeraceae archaeon]